MFPLRLNSSIFPFVAILGLCSTACGSKPSDDTGAYRLSGTLDLSGADAKLVDDLAYDYAGLSVSGAGDIDGDGTDDLLVGAYGDGEGRLIITRDDDGNGIDAQAIAEIISNVFGG